MNILIVRTSALGDIVHCLPVLSSLRRALPEARIAWVVEAQFAPLLEGHPDLTEVFVVRLRTWRKRLFSSEVRREMSSAIRALRDFRPDVTLDLMGNHKGGLLALASGARRRIGAARAFRREGSSALWINEAVEAPGPHAVDQALATLAALRVEEQRDDLGGDRLPVRLAEHERTFLDRRETPFVVIQVGAGWGNKVYPTAWWGKVAEALRERTGVEVWVPIAPGEEDLAEAVVDASSGAARSVDATPFGFLTALLKQSRLVLGGDTGPIHLAHALGTPVLCLIGPTDPARNGPYGAPDSVLWHRLPCSCCYKRYAETKACLLNLTPERVIDKALEMLQNDGRPGPGNRLPVLNVKS